MFGALFAAEGTPPGALADVAREFSPRIEVHEPGSIDAEAREIVLDLNGLTRLFGDARTIAEELRRTAADRGVRVRVAIAGTRTAARLIARHRLGLTVIEPGTEAAALAPLPIALLAALSTDREPRNHGSTEARRGTSPRFRVPVADDAGTRVTARRPDSGAGDLVATFRRWGLRTLGDLAALPPDDLAARLGRDGTEWQRLARGDDPRPLVPAVPEERFEQTLELEWPIEELEPLSFVLGRLMEPLEAHLTQRDRSAAVLHVRLHLIKADATTRDVHERTLQLPIPIRDARTLRTLALLDLESHPPLAPIDRVTVAVDPTPARIVQHSLLTRPLPSPEQISTLMARLQALMGETRCGTPMLVDSWQPGAFAMTSFAPLDDHEPRRRGGTETLEGEGVRASVPLVALRRFRHPVAVRVRVESGQPASVQTMRRGVSGGEVESCAGPWRTSGGWWASVAPHQALLPWDRDEWDVVLSNGPTYRLFRDRNTDRWFVEGAVD